MEAAGRPAAGVSGFRSGSELPGSAGAAPADWERQAAAAPALLRLRPFAGPHLDDLVVSEALEVAGLQGLRRAERLRVQAAGVFEVGVRWIDRWREGGRHKSLSALASGALPTARTLPSTQTLLSPRHLNPRPYRASSLHPDLSTAPPNSASRGVSFVLPPAARRPVAGPPWVPAQRSSVGVAVRLPPPQPPPRALAAAIARRRRWPALPPAHRFLPPVGPFPTAPVSGGHAGVARQAAHRHPAGRQREAGLGAAPRSQLAQGREVAAGGSTCCRPAGLAIPCAASPMARWPAAPCCLASRTCPLLLHRRLRPRCSRGPSRPPSARSRWWPASWTSTWRCTRWVQGVQPGTAGHGWSSNQGSCRGAAPWLALHCCWPGWMQGATGRQCHSHSHAHAHSHRPHPSPAGGPAQGGPAAAGRCGATRGSGASALGSSSSSSTSSGRSVWPSSRPDAPLQSVADDT